MTEQPELQDRAAVIAALLEPNAAHPRQDISEDAAISIAVSLKRIADALDGTRPFALDQLMENAGQAFAIGMRGR